MHTQQTIIRLVTISVALLLGAGAASAAPLTDGAIKARVDKALEQYRGNRVVITLVNRRRYRGRLVSVGPRAVMLARETGPALPVARSSIRRVQLVTATEHTSWRHRPVASRRAEGRKDAPWSSMHKTGVYVTLTGLAIAGVGGIVAMAAGFCGFGDMNFSMTSDDYDEAEPKDCSSAMTGGLLTLGVGGFLFAVGTSLWVAGSVRTSLARAGDGREILRRKWMWGGVGTTIAGLTVAGGGAAWMLAQRRSIGGGSGGRFMMSLGLYAAVLVGLPMWIEAWRLRPRQQKTVTTAAGSATGPVRHKLLVDPNHERGVRSRLAAGQPRATVFSTQFTF